MNTADPRVQASDLHSDLVQAVAHACCLTRELAQAADAGAFLSASHLTRETARVISQASDLAHTVSHTFYGLEADLANAGVNASDLVRILARSQDRGRIHSRVSVRFYLQALESNIGRAGKLVGIAATPGWRRVMPSAARLLAAAARVLPPADRERYAAEYRSELWELAHAGQPRRRQLLYASRQVVSSMRLRAELRAPRRRKASP